MTERIKILAILRNYFKLGLKDTEAAQGIQKVERNERMYPCCAELV